MPVQECQLGGKPGWKFGPSGKCYTYKNGDVEGQREAKRKAVRQGQAEHANSCLICGVSNIEDINLFSDEEMNHFLSKIFKEEITPKNLSFDMYQKTGRKLMEAVEGGWGKELIRTQFGSPDEVMLSTLRDNVYIFSAAKTYQQTKDMSAALIKEGRIATFKEFKDSAETIFTKYNKTYLSVEYDSAMAQARSASFWQEIQSTKYIYDQLEYHTVGDSRVRYDHSILNGIVRNVDDRFWNNFMPPNGWRCRCTVLQRADAKQTPLTDSNRPTGDDVPPMFRFNPGEKKIVFSPKHPYFDVSRGEKNFAKQNFGLRIP